MIAIILAAAVTAQIPVGGEGVCKAISSEILASEHELGDLAADDIADDSAPRATMRAAKATAELAAIQANIAQLQAHRCAPYPFAISVKSFMPDALGCNQAIRAAVDKHADASKLPACDRSTWQRP